MMVKKEYIIIFYLALESFIITGQQNLENLIVLNPIDIRTECKCAPET